MASEGEDLNPDTEEPEPIADTASQKSGTESVRFKYNYWNKSETRDDVTRPASGQKGAPKSFRSDVNSVARDSDVSNSNVHKEGDERRTWPEKGSKMYKQMLEDSSMVQLHGIRLFQLLGGGQVSTVYLAEDKNLSLEGHPAKVVIKVFNWTSVPGDYQRSVYPYLLKIYDNIPPHKHIMKTQRHLVDGQNHFLIQEYCPHGSLGFALSSDGMFSRGMSENTARKYMHQICQGLEYLRSCNLPHGRLTLENVLLDRNLEVKLSDYGYPPSTSCNKIDDEYHLRYRPPEMLKGRPYTGYAADIWSLGVILYAMVHSQMPYSTQELLDSERSINMPPLQFRVSLSYNCRLFLKKLLAYSPLFRPGLLSVPKDTWMTDKPKPLAKAWHRSCYHDQLRYKARLL